MWPFKKRPEGACPDCGHAARHNKHGFWCSAPGDSECGARGGPHCLCENEAYEKGIALDEYRPTEESSDGGAGAGAYAHVPSISIPYSAPSSFTTTASTSPSLTAAVAGLYFRSNQFGSSLLTLSMPPAPKVETEAWGGKIYRGWRAFQLAPNLDDASFALSSIVQTVTWESDTLQAVCVITDGGKFDVQHAVQCSCGIYLFGDKAAMMSQVMGEGMHTAILAECVGWGTVIEHELGYRVEYCRIEGLWTSGADSLNEYLSKKYGVPCRNLWESMMVLGGTV